MATLAIQMLMGLGGLILSALFTPKKPDTWGSRLSNINVPPVSPGNEIPRVWGTMKVPGQMIFCSPLIETMHTHQQSKKGGGKGQLFGGNTARTFTFTYSVDIAFGVAVGPIYQLNRIWANQKLLWVDDAVQTNTQAAFDAAYQSEATRLIDEEGYDSQTMIDYAAASAFVFAWNNYMTAEITLTTPQDAVNYIMDHPIDDTQGVLGTMVYPDENGVIMVVDELYSGLNNQNTYEAQINRFDAIEIYNGDEFQGPNGLLEGYLGQGNAPSFRGMVYFVLTNLQLMDFGNTIPTVTVEIQKSLSGTTSLPEIMTAVCYQTGLLDGQFDAISNVDPTPFPGYAVTANISAREIIGELQKVFPIDAAETGFKLVFNMLNQRPTQIFNRQDLGAHVDTDPLPASQEITVASDYDLPQRINLKYQEPARAYSINLIYTARYNTPSRQVENNDCTIALDRATAQTALNNLLMNRLFARRSYKMIMPRQYVTCEPTDVFKLPNKMIPDIYDEYYCTEVHVGANGLVEVHAVDHFYVDPALAPKDQVGEDLSVDNPNNTELPGTSATVVFMLDLPLLTETDKDGPGFYVTLAGAFNQWQGGQLYVDAASPSTANAFGLTIVTPTSGSAWEMVAASTFNVPQGVVLNALAPGMTGQYWDRQSVLIVRIANGMNLQSANEDDMMIQPLNATVIGAEVVQYSTAVDCSNGMWRLSGFLRGLRGTENRIGGHVSGEPFVRLSQALQRVMTTKADIGVADSYRALSLYAANTAADLFSFTDTGGSCKPLTVAVYQKFRNVDGDVTLSWWPRMRQGGLWLDGSEVTLPTNDTPETYQVDVCTAANDQTVVKTYTFTGAQVALGCSFVYTAAMQAADLGSAKNPVYLAIYQISQIVGRGFGVGVTL